MPNSVSKSIQIDCPNAANFRFCVPDKMLYRNDGHHFLLIVVHFQHRIGQGIRGRVRVFQKSGMVISIIIGLEVQIYSLLLLQS